MLNFGFVLNSYIWLSVKLGFHSCKCVDCGILGSRLQDYMASASRRHHGHIRLIENLRSHTRFVYFFSATKLMLRVILECVSCNQLVVPLTSAEHWVFVHSWGLTVTIAGGGSAWSFASRRVQDPTCSRDAIHLSFEWSTKERPPLWSTGYKHRGPGFDSRALLRIFMRELGLERGPLSLVIG
jgi:hypothetical protein